MENRKGKYDDIINLPHPTSSKHPRMSTLNRATQFAPFAALSGYDAAIKEKARVTEDFIELTDEEKEIINNKILLAISSSIIVKITYFQPDEKKFGGKNLSVTGKIIIIDKIKKVITLDIGVTIAMNFIKNISYRQ